RRRTLRLGGLSRFRTVRLRVAVQIPYPHDARMRPICGGRSMLRRTFILLALVTFGLAAPALARADAVAPAVGLAPASLSFAVAVGQTVPSQTLHLTNTGGGILDWSVTSDSAWLSSTPASGV